MQVARSDEPAGMCCNNFDQMLQFSFDELVGCLTKTQAQCDMVIDCSPSGVEVHEVVLCVGHRLGCGRSELFGEAGEHCGIHAISLGKLTGRPQRISERKSDG
jgi:hypothetical protein